MPKSLSKTNIDWATHVFNPVSGCFNCKRHPFCYAKSFWERRVRTNPALTQYKDVPFEQITWREENWQKMIPKNAIVFVNSMSEFKYWFGKYITSKNNARYSYFEFVWNRMGIEFEEETGTIFLLLTHHLDAFNLTKTFAKYSNLRYGLSITPDAVDGTSALDALRAFLDAPKEIRSQVDFLSIEPYMIQNIPIEIFDNLCELPRGFRIILGGLEPPTNFYKKCYSERFGWFVECTDFRERFRLLIKHNATKCFGVPCTIQPKTPAREKHAILTKFWRNE